uniref:uncharacterized protein LOC122596332 isoform X2 n=1 Tax=Erigeron canadensis TaxID=72917 RepID=UPI001CB89D79|nr:uncharacterized protein LOC122596332 isoform X2 [Erigeron canadensis]
MSSGSANSPSGQPMPMVAGVKRRSNDIGWDYGVCPDPNNWGKIKCNLCSKVVSGGITRLKQHIGNVTGQVSSCPNSTKEDQVRCRDAILKKKAKKEDNEVVRSDRRNDTNESAIYVEELNVIGPMDNFVNKVNPEEKEEAKKEEKSEDVELSGDIQKDGISMVKKYICRWAYECGIPFDAFETDSFKKLLEVVGEFGPGLPPPTPHEMSTTLLMEEVERTKSSLKTNEEEWKEDGCSIMMDAWSHKERKSIMSLCVNSKMGTVFISSKECRSEAHTSERIYKYVEGCIQEVGAEHVVQIVTDDASNNMEAAKLLKATRPKIFWTSCATHAINLMLEGIGALPRYKKILDQAKELTIFIYSHNKTLAMMRKFTKKKNIVRPGVTRFASAYLTLQSLSQKKEQLRHMFSSPEWEECKFFNTVKGKATYAMVLGFSFWAGVSLCLKVFTPLVKILRMVDADQKPSMGFVYGELIKAKEDIKGVLGGNEKAYEPVINIIDTKMKGRLDSVMHLTAYFLNPYYFYKDLEIQDDPDVSDAIVEFFETILTGDLEMQVQVLMAELPKYRNKMDRFGTELAISSCKVNNDDYDPVNWWGTFGGVTPNLKKIAMRILSLTSSSWGCERNWRTHEGNINRLEASQLKNLAYVQFNSYLMEKNKRRKERNIEVLLSKDSDMAQEWIAESDGDGNEVEVQPNSETHWEAVGEAVEADEYLEP